MEPEGGANGTWLKNIGQELSREVVLEHPAHNAFRRWAVRVYLIYVEQAVRNDGEFSRRFIKSVSYIVAQRLQRVGTKS